MNYLAHAYLSFGEPAILAGNIFSDFVKGKKQFDFPEGIRKGISLHRAIDDFTDHHEATAKAKEFFRPAYRLYSGAFVDVVYDHFLARDRNIFADDEELAAFSQATYRQLGGFRDLFPGNFGTIYYYMQLHDWLYNYRHTDGVFRSFEGLVRRAAYMHDARQAQEAFMDNYDALQACYEGFFPELKAFVLNY
jgi:acyl carrier protein phosphodiesterase